MTADSTAPTEATEKDETPSPKIASGNKKKHEVPVSHKLFIGGLKSVTTTTRLRVSRAI